MLKLIKHLKGSVCSIILIVGLLIIQAVCDLSLPDYTSNIVNIGIQQGGVEDALPKAIRKSELEKLTMFMDSKDKKEVENNYKLLDKNDLSQSEYDKYLKKYPDLKNEDIYTLNIKDEKNTDEINNIMGKSILIASGLEENKADMLKQMSAQGLPVDKNTDIVDVFKMMPQEQIQGIQKEMTKKFDDLPESMITQAAVSYVQNEYKAIGMNTDKLQNNYILVAGAKMVGVALVSMASTVCVGYLGARVAAKMGRNLRKQVFSKVVSFSNNELDKFSTASLITRSTNDIQQVQMLMVMLLKVVFYAPILALGGVIKVLNTDTSMAWIIGVAVLAILSVVLLLFGLVMPRFKVAQKLVDRLNLVTREILTGMLVIRAFNTEKHEEKRFDKANTDLTKTNMFVNRAMSMMMPTMMLIMNIITILIVYNGAKSVDAGSMQVGNMMAFIQYTMQIIMSFLMISMVSIMLPRALISIQRIDEILITDNSIKDIDNEVSIDEDKKGIIEFKNVCFRYPNAEEDVLSNISFTANAGETTAFIGSTGSGKSTLVNLIPRFYDVTSGEVSIDGIDIKDLKQYELREKIGYVPQKAVMFTGTVNSNVAYGKNGKKILAINILNTSPKSELKAIFIYFIIFTKTQI